MQFPAPPAPVFAAGESAIAPGRLRYEDLTMHGRLMPIALPHTLSGLWRDVLGAHASARAARTSGVIPLLTRMTLVSTGAVVRIDDPVESRAGFQLAHARAPDGEVARLFLNCWSDTYASSGELAGRLFAEHTFTRPFAPADQRRVTRFDMPDVPAVPPAHYDAPPPASAGDAPPDARWADELAPDSAEVCFGLDHTDLNQHVNSLVYVRVFLEAVQRHLAAAGRPWRVRSRAVEIAYRKPSFAGDRVRAHARLFEHAGELGAAGHIAADGDAKPRCYVRVLLDA